MSDVPVEATDDDQGDGPAALREAARRGEKAQKENQRLALENQLLRAGIDAQSEDPLTQMFVRDVMSRDGELEIESIKAEALSIGVLKPPSEPETQTIPQTEVEQTEVRNLVTAGESVPVGDTEDGVDATQHPMQEAYKDFQDSMRQGRNRDAAVGQAMNDVIAAAASGDERVQWDGFTEDEVRAGDASRINSAVGQGTQPIEGR